MGDYATFQYSGKVAPMEEVQSVDGNRKRIVYSTIDKVLGGASEYQLGDAGDNLISYKEYTTTNSRVSLEHSTIFNNSGIGLNFLAIFIKEAAVIPYIFIDLNSHLLKGTVEDEVTGSLGSI